MNKSITVLVLLFGFNFCAVTGYVVDSGSGIFLKSQVLNIDKDTNDSIDPSYGLSIEHKMSSGLELAFSYVLKSGIYDNYNPINLEFSYHFNDKISAGIRVDDIVDDLDCDCDTRYIQSSFYDSDAFIDFSYNLDADKHQLSIEIGKLMQINSMIFGATYTANLSDIHMGFINVTLGAVF